MPFDIFRMIALASGAFSASMLILTILKMRQESRLSKLTPISAIATTTFATLLYIMISGASVNGLIAAALAAVGLVIGLLEGQMTQLYYRGEVLAAKRSVLYLILWGCAYLLTVLLTQTKSAAFTAAGVLALMFGLGLAVGSNLNLLVRQSTMHPASAIASPAKTLTSATRPVDLPGSSAQGIQSKPTDLPG